VPGATPLGVVHFCRRCKGRMVGLATLRHDNVSRRFLTALWQTAQYQKTPRGRPCPHCDQPMNVTRLSAEGRNLELDVCRHCQSVWFDPAEYGQLPHGETVAPAAPARADKPMSPRAQEAIARLELQRVKRRHQTDEALAGGAPAEGWKLLPAILGMPVEVDAPPLAARPVATWGLTGVLIAVFLMTGMGSLESAQEFGFIPSQWSREGGLTLLYSFFLHGGWLHLIGNLYFLVIFGDNVEDRLGKWRFLALALGAHLAGAILHGALEPRSDLPLVGASGGIFGLVAFYALTFPKARLAFFLRFAWVRVPAWGMLGFFLLLQLLGAWAQIQGFSSTSSLGHLGGIAVGAVAALLCRLSAGRRKGHAWFKQERGRMA
jgi:membrane associated rhomboid family serine protease